MRVDLPDEGTFQALPMVMEPMEQALRTIEAHCEDTFGWDAKPVFGVLAGDVLSAVVMHTVDLPEFVYLNPGEGLPILVEILTNKELGPVGDGMRARLKSVLPEMPLLGIFLINEAWAVYGKDAVEDVPRVMPSQHPNRVEIRGGVMVTVDGRLLTIDRPRGGQPTFCELDTTMGFVSGRIPDAMRRLLDILETLSRERTE